MFRKIILFVIKIFSLSLCFKIPGHSRVLLYSQNSKILLKTISNNTSDLIIDRQKINIFILFFSIIKFKFTFLEYTRTFIKVVNPKLIITFADNDLDFYKLKFFYPNIYFIAVQNGYRFKNRDFFNILESHKNMNKKMLIADFYFCFNKYYANYISKYIKSEYILHGSFRNNLIQIKKPLLNYKNFLFISQFTTRSEIQKKTFFSVEKKILPIIEDYCRLNKMSFFVLFRNNKSDKNFKNEMRFYKSLLKFKFTPIINRGNSYKIVDLHDNIITVDSTLGYECLVRNKKVFFFHDRIITEDKKNFKDAFGWPKPIHCNTGINLTKINKRQIYNFFNVNLRLDYNEWNSKYKLSFKDLMSFDYKNRALTELVKQCIKN